MHVLVGGELGFLCHAVDVAIGGTVDGAEGIAGATTEQAGEEWEEEAHHLFCAMTQVSL